MIRDHRHRFMSRYFSICDAATSVSFTTVCTLIPLPGISKSEM